MDSHRRVRTVLIVDDDRELTALMRARLSGDYLATAVAHCGAEAVAWLTGNQADLMLLGFELPDMNGFEVVEKVNELGHHIPFVVVTRRGDEHIAVEMMKRGARDYLVKDISLSDLLPSAVRQILGQLERDQRLQEAERRLQEQNRFLQCVVNSLPHPLYVIDAHSCAVRLANQAAHASGRIALSLGSAGRAGPAEHTVRDSPIAEVRRSQKPLTLEHVQYEPGEQASIHEIHLCPVFDEGGEVGRVIEYDLDVTTRRRAEQALRESEARLRQVVESLPIVLLSRDADSDRLILVIGAVDEILGYHGHQLMEDPGLIERIVHPEDARVVRTAFREIVSAQKPLELDFRIHHGSDGRTVWLHARGVPVCDEEGSLLRVDSLLVDISRERESAAEREQLESHLQRAQRLESLGVLAGGIAHDFNNLLTIISGNAQFLRESLCLGQAESKALADIETAARNATDMTRTLQAFSRPGKPQMEHTDADTLVCDIYQFLRRLIPARIDFQFLPAAGPCTIAVDRVQVQQILVNLCINSRDAIGAHGRLEIHTRQVDPLQIPPASRGEAHSRRYLEIRVTDNGCGMDQGVLQKVFDPFFTTKPKDQATGLGLAIVYKIVQEHQGMINAVSEPGEGTEIRVYLPVVEVPLPAPPEGSGACVGGRGHVLVVDDEPLIASLIKTLLESSGYEVRVTHHPEGALTMVQSAEWPPDLVVMDYGLPGMSGDKCLLQLRQQLPDLRAMLITGYEAGELEPGLEDVCLLRKPFSSQSILRAVREALET